MRIVQTQRDGWQVVASPEPRTLLVCPHCGRRHRMMWYEPDQGRLLCGSCRFDVGDA